MIKAEFKLKKLENDFHNSGKMNGTVKNQLASISEY